MSARNWYQILKAFLIATVVLCFVPGSRAQKWSSPGDPYGPLEQSDLVALQKFAAKSGVDLNAAMEQSYSRDRKRREEGLGRFFRFSLKFQSFDQNARTYGQLVFNSFLNLGEAYGVKPYAAVLDHQSAEVRQRVRDFLSYPTSTLPAEERDEGKVFLTQGCPALFPPQFQFAHGDALFVAHDFPEIFSLTISQDAATKDLVVKLVNVSPAQQKYVDTLAGPVPSFAFRCQFGKRTADGEVGNLSDQISLNLPQEHNPPSPAPLSTLAPRAQRTERMPCEVIVRRIPPALARAPQRSSYDCVRFLLSVPLRADYLSWKQGKTPFLDLKSYQVK